MPDPAPTPDRDWPVAVVVRATVRHADQDAATAIAVGAVRKALADPAQTGPGVLPADIGIVIHGGRDGDTAVLHARIDDVAAGAG